MKTILLSLFTFQMISAQVIFDEYFENKTLRFDYFHTGDKNSDSYSFDELIEEPFWGGSKVNLIDKFNYGKCKFEVYDFSSNKLIYSRTYSTLFSEWQTTEEASITQRTFSETVVFPFPKNKVRIEFYGRTKENKFEKRFDYTIDPANYFIKPEREFKFDSFKVMGNGDPAVKVDIVLIPEGYTESEMTLFKGDCEKFAGYLFNSSPFKENKDKFNIWAVEAPSIESGTDIPAEDIWKNTLVDSRFYTFDLERYLMTADNKTLRSVASNAPYDQIYILVNSSKYGGGSIYNHYSVCVNNNPYEEYVFVHEFGHGFGSLADEYYTSDVAYENFYPLHLEPLDPNITTLVDFDSKWKDMIDQSTPVPTPQTDEYKNVVGAFEGGGYVAKGVYRPMQDCTMKSLSKDNFCKVCRRALQQMIDFYSE
jgi:hypothetical protein